MSCFTAPKNILIGKNAIEEAKPLLKEYGKRAFIVTGKHVVLSSMMEELKKALEECNIEFVIYDGIIGEPTDLMIAEGVSLYKEKKCDFCIGIGGGSPLDSAKAIAAMITNEGKISDYMGKIISNKTPPVVAIPTTSGTGSEATRFSVITDSKRNIKMLLKGDVLLPELAIIDYTYTISSPKTVTAATGLDALTHAIEAFTSKKAFSMTDTLAISAIKRIMKYLPIAYEDGKNERAREEMSIAALEAGICINNSSVTLVHGLSRPIGALFHVPHGISNAMLLTECLEFAKDGIVEKLEQLAISIGIEKNNSNLSLAFLNRVRGLCDECDVKTLQEYGIDEDKYFSLIDKMANDAIGSGSPSNTIKTVTVEDCKEIYKKVYKK